MRNRDYHKLGDDLKVLDSLRKRQFFGHIKEEIVAIRQQSASKSKIVDPKALTTLKILRGGYRNLDYEHVQPRYN